MITFTLTKYDNCLNHLEHIHLKYGIIRWGNSKKTFNIFKIQKRPIRNILEAKILEAGLY